MINTNINPNEALKRIGVHLRPTPIFRSRILDKLVGGHELFFKAEMLQKTGSFKSRGALNTLLWAKEQGLLTDQIVAVSSGNHAQAVAWAASLLGVKARVFMASSVSEAKLNATRAYGAEVVICENRAAANRRVEEERGFFFVPPFDHDEIIAGQATSCLEAWMSDGPYDAVFAPCGGGGLLSGSLISTRLFSKDCQVFGSEPLTANDAAQSIREGSIIRLSHSPDTICDGAQTLAISERSFKYLKQVQGIFEVDDNDVMEWARQILVYLKLSVEPTGALGMPAAARWLRDESVKRRVLIILSGGNMDKRTLAKMYG
jgi:threonine dehydratase